MSVNHGGTANHATSAYARTAGDANTPGNGRVIANANVVRNLDEVVNLHAIADHSVLDCATVNRGVGTDVYIVAYNHRADLSDFAPALADWLKAEAIGTDDGTSVEDAAIPYAHA